jgi:hypothetical protein
MREVGNRAVRNSREVYEIGLSPDGRAALALGMIALVFGFAAVAAGAYIALYGGMPKIALPGGLAAADRDMVGMFLSAIGALTTLVGGVSIYRSQEM